MKSPFAAVFPGLAAALLAACAPSLNWRELRPEGSGAAVMFPCKPDHEVRQLPLGGGAPVAMTMMACHAGDTLFALGFADVGDPSKVGPALVQLQAGATLARRQVTAAGAPAQVDGMTPHPEAKTLTLSGQLPDGTAVSERLTVFSKGTRVFQLMQIGPHLDAEALRTFHTGVRWAS